MKTKILLADDENTFRETFLKVLQEEGFDVDAFDNGLDAIAAIKKTEYDIAVLDIDMPGADGIRVLKEVVKVRPDTRVIMITAFGSVEMAVEAIKIGASEYVVKPVIFEDILIKIKQQARYRRLHEENLELKNELGSVFSIDQIISESPLMTKIFETIYKVAGTKSNVLVTGESGTGKEMVAHAIHALSEGFPGRFVAVNCSAISEGLIESELFGHKKGSFTSAVEDKKGLFEAAQGGTLFLDEIGYMPLNCQVKLLRAVEERRITPVGTTESIPVDLRVIAATNKNLQNEMAAGHFREDLYYRLNVVGIHLPPLRQRKEDIPKLVQHFMAKYNKEMGKNCTSVSDKAMNMLANYEWKGNIRELQNIIERAIIFAESDVIEAADIGLVGASGDLIAEEAQTLQEALRRFEKEYIYKILKKCKGDKAEAAKVLEVGVSTLYRKISELEMNVDPDVLGD
ncbi:MAG: sigma-54-dependent Fis family transcriptional regulator [Planctomycetes bacterium]|nr:sigma-54-dependent Fis family transcriptional regulator [Planctomycetota bacterium]